MKVFERKSSTQIEIHVNDKRRIRIGEGEPEDMTLGRDLNDALSISDLIKEAYIAGRDGEELEFVSATVEDDEDF